MPGAHGDQKEISGPLELEFQMVVNHCVDAVGSSTRAASALNFQPITHFISKSLNVFHLDFPVKSKLMEKTTKQIIRCPSSSKVSVCVHSNASITREAFLPVTS